MKKRILLPLLVFVIGAQIQLVMAEDHQPILPLKPAQLLTYMPAAPVGWTMLSSLGASNFNGGWVSAYGDRTFKQNPPPPVPGAPAPAVPPPPVTMNVHLTDTGYKDDFTNIVTPSKNPGASASKATYLQIGDYPARIVKIDGTTTILNLVVNGRFLIEIRTVNLPDDKMKDMVGAFDFTKLKSVPDTGETKITNPVVLNRVDELHPENTRSYPLFWSVAPESK